MATTSLLRSSVTEDESLERRLVEALNPPAAHRPHVERLVADVAATLQSSPLLERLTQAAELAATRHSASGLLDCGTLR